MKKIIILILIFSGPMLQAQEIDSLFVKANSFYSQENYEEAINNYNSIISRGYQSEDLFYNLANSYFKNDQLAESILFYKRALKLNPNMEDASFNLNMAQNLTVDKIEKLPEGFIEKFYKWFSQLISIEQWAVLAVILAFVSSALILTYLLSAKSNIKRASFILGLSLLALMFLSIFIAHQQNSWMQNNKEAVVMSENSYVKVAPNPNSEDSFILHEGTSVVVIDEIGEWQRIRLADGKVGWINKLDLIIV